MNLSMEKERCNRRFFHSKLKLRGTAPYPSVIDPSRWSGWLQSYIGLSDTNLMGKSILLLATL